MMSARAAHDGQGSSRGIGRGRSRPGVRGRGRGRGKSAIWEWESYTPGPEVYQQLWHIRKQPAIVTASLSDHFPRPHVRTRILDRRQTEDGIQRNYYLVESTPLSDEDAHLGTSIELVDVGCILNYVSPYELERFENEQFRLEAEAEEVAARAEADELARRRLERNACEPTRGIGRGSGRGRGTQIFNGLVAGPEVLHLAPGRGKPKGRRGIYRNWRGRGQLTLNSRQDDRTTDSRIADEDPTNIFHSEEEALQRFIEQTEAENEFDVNQTPQSSPGLMRSAFVANSALPVSQTKSFPNIRRQDSQGSLISESDVELIEDGIRSVPSAAPHFRAEVDLGDGVIPESTASILINEDHHRKKIRTRSESSTSDLPISRAPTGSVFEPEGPYAQELLFRESSIPEADSISDSEPPPSQDLMFRNQSSIPEYESQSLDAVMVAPCTSQHNHASNTIHDNALDLDDDKDDADYDGSINNEVYDDEDDDDDDDENDDTIRVLPPHNPPKANIQNGTEADKVEAESTEFVVESISRHCYQAGIKYYLVKWQGYEDVYDWLHEGDLAGAAEVVEEYNKRIANSKGKMRSG